MTLPFILKKKLLEKEEQINCQLDRKKEIIKIRVKISEIKEKKRKSRKVKDVFYINKNDLIRKRENKLSISNMKHMKMLHIVISIKKVNRKYYEQLCVNKFENLGEMDKYFVTHKLLNSFMDKLDNKYSKIYKRN